MVALNTVRASNALTRTRNPRTTALFVGGTSGIGRATLQELARTSPKLTAYIVGRSAAKASPVLKDLQSINPQHKFSFIEADVSLLSNVDEACRQISAAEPSLDLIHMTPGGISLTGRNDTSEGLDHLFALRYHSRMRFIKQLLPLLNSSSSPSRVISVLGGGFEGRIDPTDFDLKRKYNLIRCAFHSVTMTSLAMEHLAASNHHTSFIHIFPGIVGTNIYTNSFPAPIAAVYNYLMWPMMWPFSVGLQETGERGVFHALDQRYVAIEGGSSSSSSSSSGGAHEEVAVSSLGKGQNSGVYLLNWKGEGFAGNKVMQEYRAKGMAEKVWTHTEALFDQVVKQT